MSDKQPSVDDAPQPKAPDAVPTAPEPDAISTPPTAEFTQADLDRIVKERLSRQREKFADYDDLKKAAAKLAEIEEEQLSEQEKLQKQLDEALQAKQQAEESAERRAILSAIVTAAAKLGFNDPGDAYALIDLNAITFDDSGNVTNATELVKMLAEQRTYLIKQQGRPLEQFNPGAGDPIKETDAQRRARLYGGSGDIFSPVKGGVIWPKGMPGTEE